MIRALLLGIACVIMICGCCGLVLTVIGATGRLLLAVLERLSPSKSDNQVVPLCGKKPIEVTRSEWPLVASARATEEIGEFCGEAKVSILQHEDGRTILYGAYTFAHSEFMSTPCCVIHAGELVEVEDGITPERISEASQRVASWMNAYLPPTLESATTLFKVASEHCIEELQSDPELVAQ
jgi:hypothetical protein